MVLSNVLESSESFNLNMVRKAVKKCQQKCFLIAFFAFGKIQIAFKLLHENRDVHATSEMIKGLGMNFKSMTTMKSTRVSEKIMTNRVSVLLFGSLRQQGNLCRQVVYACACVCAHL